MFAAPSAEAMRDVEANRQPMPPTASAPYPQQYPQAVDVQVQMAPTTKQETDPAKSQSMVVRMSNTLEWGTQMFLIAFFSLLVMIVSSQICDATQPGACFATRGYQVAAGATSFILALIFSIVHYAERLTDVNTMSLISTFFFLWWTAGVIVLTFFGDFVTTVNANGYFGAWGAFIMSIFSLVAVSPNFQSGLEGNSSIKGYSLRKPLFFLAISSAVVMGAAIGPCSPTSNCNGYNAYALVLGVVSLFFALLFLAFATRMERNLMNFFAFLSLVWWIFGTAVVTLGGPFKTTGNGYFGSFAALLSSMAWLRAIAREPAK